MNYEYFVNTHLFDHKNQFILNTTWFKVLPIELIYIIYKENIDWAMNILNKHMKPFFKVHLKNKIEFISSMTTFAGFQCNLGFGMYNYSLFYKNRIMHKEETLKILNMCKCCERHQIKRPKTLTKWVDIELNNNWQHHICECECRHLARYICRSCE
tara:strand:+ start:45 stop:512 length:468 start_codon:yes stop_codon:yes gene_type:complete